MILYIYLIDLIWIFKVVSKGNIRYFIWIKKVNKYLKNKNKIEVYNLLFQLIILIRIIYTSKTCCLSSIKICNYYSKNSESPSN
jgi:hypothetical protein